MGKSAVSEMATDTLFRSAHAALTFAFNFSGQSYERPLMNRMADEPAPPGKGLVGIDGAAQAGMIRAEVHALGRLAESILIARVAPRTTPCSCRAACCSGHRPNKEWTDAIAYLSDEIRRSALAGCTSNGLLRRAYVVRYFSPREQRISIEQIADKYDVSRNTVSAHAGKVAGWLAGSRLKDSPPGMETLAMQAIDDRLRGIGLIGA